jgi:hypothetical protein
MWGTLNSMDRRRRSIAFFPDSTECNFSCGFPLVITARKVPTDVNFTRDVISYEVSFELQFIREKISAGIGRGV